MYINEYRLDLDEDCRPCLVKTSRYHVDGRVKYNNPDILSDFIFYDLGIGKRAEEHLYLLMLDNAGHMIGISEISHGTANQSLCDVQSILTKALLMGAKKVVMTHNHPSGDVFPSAEDRLVTKRVQAALELSGISLKI